MYEQALRQMRENIRTRYYVMTLHAEDEMNNDNLTIFDVERAILAGVIDERQEDYTTGEWKYLITGRTIYGDIVTVVAKISATGKLVIITVYKEEIG